MICGARIFCIGLIFLAIGGCRTRNSEGVLRSQSPTPSFEVIPHPTRYDSIQIPSYPLRVAVKFILSGINLDGEPSSPDLKYTRFLQMLEYLDQYARLDSMPIGGTTSSPNSTPTYLDWMRTEHKNLPPFARFDREMRALLRNPNNHDPDSALKEIIPPRYGRSQQPPVGTEARKMMSSARSHLTDWMREARLHERTADFLSEEFLRPHRDAQQGIHSALQMIVPSALLNPVMSLASQALDAAEQNLATAINPLTPKFTLEDTENLLFQLAQLRHLIRSQRNWVIQLMTQAEEAMRHVKSTAQERVQLLVSSGYFRAEDPATESLLSLMIGGYIESMPEAQARDIFSDLIDAASPQLSQQAVLEATLRNSGPLAKKTLQLFADARGLSPEVKSIFNGLLASNEAMDFSLVLQALSDPKARNLRTIRVYERPLGVGSLADVYRIDVQPDAPFLASPPHDRADHASPLSAVGIQQEWQAQACLSAAEGNTLKKLIRELSKQRKALPHQVVSACERHNLDTEALLTRASTPEWIRSSVRNRTIPLAVRILKPETEEYLEKELHFMTRIIDQYDRAMSEDEQRQLTSDNRITHFRPRFGNILSAYVDLIKEELNTALTVQRQQRASTPESAYESLIADPSGPFLLRTRVPRIALFPQSQKSSLKNLVIIQEYLPGSDFVEAMNQSQIDTKWRKRAAHEMLKIWLRAAVYDETRLVHADLHRGNILTHVLSQRDNPVIQTALIDFGMAVDTKGDNLPDFSFDLINLGIGAERKDIDRILHALRSLASLTDRQRSADGYTAQREQAVEFLRSYKDPKGSQAGPPMDVWFTWAKDQLPVDLRLQFPTYVLNLIRGYLSINALYSGEGASDWDAIRVNVELALESKNLAKIWDAYRQSGETQESLRFQSEKDLAEDLRKNGPSQ